MAMVWKDLEAFKGHVEQMRMFHQTHPNNLGVRVSRRDLINSMWPLLVTGHHERDRRIDRSCQNDGLVGFRSHGRGDNTPVLVKLVETNIRKYIEEGLIEMKKRPLIMAVDDEETLRKLIRVNLTVDGYDVITAPDGDSALTMLEEREPDLVLLDIMMPGLDGFQTLDLIRQRSNVPVIMLTARCEMNTIRDTLGLGADDYITKPFSLQVLAARIRAKLRRAGQEEAQVAS